MGDYFDRNAERRPIGFSGRETVTAAWAKKELPVLARGAEGKTPPGIFGVWAQWRRSEHVRVEHSRGAEPLSGAGNLKGELDREGDGLFDQDEWRGEHTR